MFQTAYVRTGTEKGTGELRDKFIVDRSGATGEPTGQVVTLYPDKKRIYAELDFDDGVLAHEAHYLLAMARRDKKNEKVKK